MRIVFLVNPLANILTNDTKQHRKIHNSINTTTEHNKHKLVWICGLLRHAVRKWDGP